MFQITKQGPDSKKEATAQVLPSTLIKHLFTIPIKFWLLAFPHSFEGPDELPVSCVQSVVVLVPANQMLKNQQLAMRFS